MPGSRKLIENGVPFREVVLSGGEAPVRLYDTSGPYTDDNAAIDIQKGLAARRRDWKRLALAGTAKVSMPLHRQVLRLAAHSDTS